MFYLSLLELGQSGDILGRHPESSSLNGRKWYPPTGISLGWEKGP